MSPSAGTLEAPAALARGIDRALASAPT